MKRVRDWAVMAAAVVVAVVIAEFPPAKRLEEGLSSHRSALLVVVGGMTALGFTLFMGSIVAMLMAGGEPMGHEEVEESARSVWSAAGGPRVWRASTYRVAGSAAGRQVANEATFAAMKDAWRSGDWWRDQQWRRLFVVFAGALLLVSGLFGIFIVIGPGYVKVLLCGALAYSWFMVARGFARA